MTDDHINRFNLSAVQPHRSFARVAHDVPTIKTKDNAQTVIPPPRATPIPHPRLAPPGMMGSRLATGKEPSRDSQSNDQAHKRRYKPVCKCAEQAAPNNGVEDRKPNRWRLDELEPKWYRPLGFQRGPTHGHDR